jgi:hypothetical protein
MSRWLRWPAENPARLAFTLGGWFLIFGAIQLAAAPGSDLLVLWARLLVGSGLMAAGAAQLWTGVKLRRKRRTQLLGSVVTAVSALERRRREDADSSRG